jgi:hypothetical protein
VTQFEPVFLPIWLRHYTKQVESVADCYVLDTPLPPGASPLVRSRPCAWPEHWPYSYWEVLLADEQVDGLNVVPVHSPTSFNHAWLRDTVESFAAFLLQSYDWVAFAEVDELIVWAPDLAPGDDAPTLLDYVTTQLAHSGLRFAACTGHEVVHRHAVDDPEREPDLDLYKPLMRQRGWWYPCQLYSKPAFWATPPRWGLGFHHIRGGVAPPVDPDLHMIHLHKVDFSLALARARHAASRHWSETDVAHGFGAQNRITDEAKLAAFFRAHVDHPDQSVDLVPIPDRFRDLI